MPGISNQVVDALDRGWHYATLLFGETQIRTGHLLVGDAEIDRAAARAHRNFEGVLQDSRSTTLAVEPSHDLGGLGRRQPAPDGWLGPGWRERRGHDRRAQAPKGTTALDRFRQDLTAKARAGRAWTRSSAVTRKSARSSTC